MVNINEILTQYFSIDPDEKKFARALYIFADVIEKIDCIEKYAGELRWIADGIVITPSEIRKARKLLRLTQQEFGLIVNKTESDRSAQHYISRLESGEPILTRKSAEKIRELMEKSKTAEPLESINPKIEELLNRIDPDTGRRITQRKLAKILDVTPQMIQYLKKLNELPSKYCGMIEKCVDSFQPCSIYMKY